METSSTVVIPRWQRILGFVLSALATVPFLPSALMKLSQPAGFLDGWTKNYPAGAAQPLGMIELACAVLYWVPATRVLGAILLTGYLGGAIATHVHMADGHWPLPLTIGVLAWAGLAGVEPRLRALLPLRKA